MQPFPDYLKRKGYRLPTGAEWEYAARADSTSSRYYGSSADLLPRYAWYINNAELRTWPVGQKRPNDFGLFDMHGHVSNWIQEHPIDYRTAAKEIPAPDREETTKVLNTEVRGQRGGSISTLPQNVRSAYHFYGMPMERSGPMGFRPARTCE
jgi:formylglycine-generating enzyme required for sulfatase activity